MAPTRRDLELAIAGFWATKDKQGQLARQIGSTAEGSAKAVRGGGQFNSVATLISRFFVDAGYPPSSVRAGQRNTILPGYFRPTKSWDLVVVHKGILVAAFELKSLGERSMGNNFNNRVEEALGNSRDLSESYGSGLLGKEKPWQAYFFVLDDSSDAARSKRRLHGPTLFPTDRVWDESSYEDRFSVAGRRLVEAGIYDAVCYFTSSPRSPGPREPDSMLDWRHFCAAIQGRMAYLAGLGLP